jgi:aminoglycoside 6'-N-acetyltransferase
MAATRYRFRPVTRDDFPLLRRWFEQPHVNAWWDGPDGALAEIAQAMEEPWTRPFIVLFDDQPIGYQQVYDPHAEDDHPYRDQPPGTLGIDQFIGEPDMIERGHGNAFIRAFVEQLFAEGAPRVITDPDPTNARAIRAYKKAGFRTLERRMTIFGEAELMARERETV